MENDSSRDDAPKSASGPSASMKRVGQLQGVINSTDGGPYGGERSGEEIAHYILQS